MTLFRRGLLMLLAGSAVLGVRGSDEAARFLARGADDVYTGSKKADEASVAAKSADEPSAVDRAVNHGKRAVRRKAIREVIEGEEKSQEISLAPGMFGGYYLRPTAFATLNYSYTVTRGDSVEVFVLDSEEFAEYIDGGPVTVGDSGWWDTDSQNELSVELTPFDTYYLVFDHTDAGFPGTDGQLTVETTAALDIV